MHAALIINNPRRYLHGTNHSWRVVIRLHEWTPPRVPNSLTHEGAPPSPLFGVSSPTTWKNNNTIKWWIQKLECAECKVSPIQSSRPPAHKICVQDFVNKYRPLTITLKSHSLGPLDHTCPFCRSSQIFINILLLLSRHCPFDFLVYIFYTGDELILRFRIHCLVLPKCQDYRIFFWSKQGYALLTSLSPRWQSIPQSQSIPQCHLGGVGWDIVLKTKYICWMLMHGWMQDSTGDDSCKSEYFLYQISLMDLFWNLHCG